RLKVELPSPVRRRENPEFLPRGDVGPGLEHIAGADLRLYQAIEIRRRDFHLSKLTRRHPMDAEILGYPQELRKTRFPPRDCGRLSKTELEHRKAGVWEIRSRIRGV